jgi:beta-carotene 15,15'-monooxygenase
MEVDAGADHFGEPIFVPNPDGADEDAGVVLTLALDVDDARSDLIVLDGSALSELARARLPRPVPFDFHGRFFPEVLMNEYRESPRTDERL